MKDILLIGGGGHCKSVIDTLISSTDYNIIGILDTPDKVGEKIHSVEVIGVDDDLQKYYDSGINYAFITLGSIGDTHLRVELYNKARAIGFDFPVIIDFSAVVSPTIHINNGSYIGKGAILNSDVSIGECCIINSGAIIEHDCKISSFCHIAPGTTMSGNVSLGKHTHIGTNSTIIQNITIGSHTIIGAGSVVISDFGSYKKAYGNPCKEANDD